MTKKNPPGPANPLACLPFLLPSSRPFSSPPPISLPFLFLPFFFSDHLSSSSIVRSCLPMPSCNRRPSAAPTYFPRSSAIGFSLHKHRRLLCLLPIVCSSHSPPSVVGRLSVPKLRPLPPSPTAQGRRQPPRALVH